MKHRILGLVGGRRRRSLLAGTIAVMAAGVFAISALAVHDLAFQLDGDVDAATQTNVGGNAQTIDWSSLFNAAGQELPLPADFDASSFDRDFNTNPNGSFSTSDNTTFATGSKDTLPISGWQCNQDNNVTSKVDIMNAYAASYTAADGDEILYFALERNANTGTADVGFWFLQDENVNCESQGGTTTFGGAHVNGDLLVVAEFTQGGVVSTIQVYAWVGGANGALNPNPVASGVDCKTTAGADTACGTVNTGTIATPWLTSNKQDGVGHSLRISEFFEGGINLTNANLGNKCFNTFMANTRSSTSLTATLFDFSRGELGECTSTTTTTPKQGDPPVNITSAPIPASGQLIVRDSALIEVNGVNTFSGTVTFFLCRSSELRNAGGTLDPNGTCTTGGTQIGAAKPVTSTPSTVLSDTAGLTAADRYCWRAVFSGDDVVGVPGSEDSSAGECFIVTPLQPTLTTDATDGPVDFGQPISDTISLTGTANSPGTNGIGPGGTINATNRQPANGTISFTAFGPGNCATVAHSGTITVSGDNAAYGGPGSSTQFIPGAPGVYTYVASYSGDSPNTLGVPATACPDPTGTEVVTVRQIPTSILTDQWVYPNDSATVSSTVASRELPTGGEIVFKLYNTVANCQANGSTGLLGTFTDSTVGGGGAGNTARTNNTTIEVQADATVAWRVTYDPKNSAFTGRQSACVERTAVDFTDDPGPGTLFP